MANETLNALLKEYEQKKVKEEISADERKEEYAKLQEGQNLAVKAVSCWIREGIDNTMNKFNNK